MSTVNCQFMWFIRKPALSSKYKAYELSRYIDKYKVIKETPKGWRVECRYNDQGRVMLEEHYHAFYSENDALEFLASEANNMAALLDERKLSYTRLLCDCHDALRKTKGN